MKETITVGLPERFQRRLVKDMLLRARENAEPQE